MHIEAWHTSTADRHSTSLTTHAFTHLLSTYIGPLPAAIVMKIPAYLSLSLEIPTYPPALTPGRLGAKAPRSLKFAGHGGAVLRNLKSFGLGIVAEPSHCRKLASPQRESSSIKHKNCATALCDLQSSSDLNSYGQLVGSGPRWRARSRAACTICLFKFNG